MFDILKEYTGKQIKVHLGPEWNYFGRVISVNSETQILRMLAPTAEITVSIPLIKAITYVPAGERKLPEYQESPYHPTKRTFYRR